MLPILPQNDNANFAIREAYLEKNRKLYKFDFDYLNPLPLLDTDPNNRKVDVISEKENFSAAYNSEKLAAAVLPLAQNLLLAKVRGLFDPFDKR